MDLPSTSHNFIANSTLQSNANYQKSNQTKDSLTELINLSTFTMIEVMSDTECSLLDNLTDLMPDERHYDVQCQYCQLYFPDAKSLNRGGTVKCAECAFAQGVFGG